MIFLKAKAVEINASSQTLLALMKNEWEKKGKPKEVCSEAIKQLKQVLEVMGMSGTKYYTKEVLDAGLPGKAESAIEIEVNKRLDVEFQRRVEENSEKRAQTKLEYLKAVHWPEWYMVNVSPKLADLESRFRTAALDTLKGPWTISCDKCGLQQQIELTPEEIAEVLRLGSTSIGCADANCTDKQWFQQVRHRIRLDFQSLFEAYLGRPP